MGKNAAYAAQYAEEAKEQMRRYGIPASVILAQAILESSNGQSQLSRECNNHFGIKATDSWLKNGGEYGVYTDDKPDGARFEIIGGMPCFDPSLLPVQSVTDRNILLQCPSIGQVTLVYNMKWTEQESDVNNKKAFLRSLMLHIYAQLYDDGCCPTRLKWSYLHLLY